MKYLDRFLQRRRMAKARPYLPPGARVLDVGCHQGEFFARYSGRIASGVGVDPELNDPGTFGKIHLVRGSFPADLPNVEPFDRILMLAVLEHVPSVQQLDLVKACRRFLKPQGKVLVTVPSPRVDAVLRMLKGLRLIEGIALDQHYSFDPQQTVTLFKQARFDCLRHDRFQLGFNHFFVFQHGDETT